MRPILFSKDEQSFDTYGLGELDVTKGNVTRERNGNYTLYAEIPVNDPMVSILQKEMKLKVDAGLRTKNQTIEISRIVKDSSNIVKIYGQHISHKLKYMALRNATAFAGSAYSALAIWKGALIGDLRFDVWSDIQTTANGVFDISKMENARQALGGVEGSILDIYGGEYEFDNMTVRLHKQLGRTAPTVLEYGRNILSAESDETIESSYTSVLPFATYTPDKPEGDTSDSQPDPVTVTLPENYVDSKYKALYAHRRIKVVDFSSEFKSDSKNKDIPTPEKLRKLATDYMERNAIGKPKINIKIEYADLAKTLDYADRGWIEEVELCDIVPVYYPQIGLTDETLEITTITYDFINERNESVEFGDIGTSVRATMQSGLAGKVDDIAKAQQDFENSLPDYLLNAQGNKVWYNQPDDKEHKVGDIWFEKNGIYDRMYVWNGEMWEKRIDTEDIDKIKKEVDKQLEQAKQSTAIEIAKADAKAQEALAKAGTIPDVPTLSEQIKAQVMNSEEFNHLSETSKLYERVIGQSETDMPDKLSRLVMGSQIFQTEVGQYVNTNGANLLNGSKGPFKPDKKPANFDNNILYKDSTSIYMEQGQEYIVSAKTDGNFSALHENVESDNVVLWLMDDKYQNYQIVSDLKTGTTGTKITWNKPTGTYHLRVNTYHKDPDKLKSVWDVKIEKGSIKSDYTLSLTDQLKADPLFEATRTQVTQLAGSYSIKNINSAGDIVNSLNLLPDGTTRFDGKLLRITGRTVIDEAVIDGASIKSLSASKLSGGEADFAKMNVVNFDAKNVTSGTFTGLTFRGGRIEGLNGKMYIDLQNSQYNVLNNEATIRRIDDTNSSQFIKLTKSGFVAERFRDSNAALMVLGTNHNKDPKEVERHDNDTFAGIRIWSGKGSGTEESLTEFVGDRVLIYNNGRYRSPWNFHGNTNDGNTYIIPMNQNGVKHFIGRGDFFLEGIYSRHFYMSGGTDIGVYLWDLLTCIGMLKRHGTISGASGHIQGVLDKYGFR
ncbi:phage tail spike protein [Streptococcus parasanguinis]|uniref:phage tail spike protein n=1 Tax=Streptococcus parasanguinis TaxID=1318 RepID=UPI0039C408C7